MIERKERVAAQWFAAGPLADDAPTRTLDALHRYSAAETAMLQRVRARLGLNDNDLTALDHLVRARRRDQPVNPTDLKDGLRLSMASVTVMIDRLERAGYVTRQTDPGDSRRRLIVATPAAEDRVGGPLEAIRRRITAALVGLSDEQTDTVVAFLDRASDALDEVDASAAPSR